MFSLLYTCVLVKSHLSIPYCSALPNYRHSLVKDGSRSQRRSVQAVWDYDNRHGK
ncbi:hypothetical protein IF2G_02450 [Cordyceps javanica]|nr:hypothetical protein IF2G_02450 [Cordyceps javanica]